MPAARIRSLEFVPADKELSPESAGSGLRAGLEDGGESTFFVATPDQPARWLEQSEFSFGAPVLFVRRLDQENVAEAAQAMAADMGGYWLRYYNSVGEATPDAAPAKPPRKTTGCKVVSASISEAYPPRSPDGCAVVQARIDDDREFSLLTATPAWFTGHFEQQKLPYYYGPSVLFVRRLEPRLVRRAVNAMAAHGDRWLCRYDTPRRTLPEVLADFKAKHFAV